jgi:type I restriction enzyme M protein
MVVGEVVEEVATISTKEPRRAYIEDYISGRLVEAKPEELEAVQIFSRRLVEEYGYPKEYIQTRPQFMVKEAPSGAEKWPVDITVFRDTNRAYGNVWMVVECKRRNVREGRKQLEIYMNLTSAQVGVWFNGDEHLYLRKRIRPDGTPTIEPINALPRYGQTLADIGRIRRRDLKPPSNLKATLRDIRNHLMPMTTGVTRDETFARELINILFCKIYDELNTDLDDPVSFFAGDEPASSVRPRIINIFDSKVRGLYDDVFDRTDAITLDADSVAYVVGELQNIAVTEAARDAVGDAFEVFIGPALKGSQGQFFTPRNVIKMMVEIIDPEPDEYLIDPACGSGGFLIVALEHVWRKLEARAARRGWGPARLEQMKRDAAARYFRGIEKDSFLAKVTKAYMAIIGDGRGGIFCDDALKPFKEWPERVQEKIAPGQFSYVFTNPPFGSKIQVEGAHILGQFPLGYTWKREGEEWAQGTTIPANKPPQLLFIDRCLQLLKPGGKLAIVLPESIFGNPSHGYITSYLAKNIKITGLVSMPEDLFQPYTHAKACVLFPEKSAPPKDGPVKMGVVKWCGHDSRGNAIPYDDVPAIAERFRLLDRTGHAPYDRLGFLRMMSEIQGNIFIPKYYDPEIVSVLKALEPTHELAALGDLIRDKAIAVNTGHEVGKLAYGTGPIPFVRTSDLANWELKIDPKQGVSEEIYASYSTKQDVQAGDILMVRDGTYLVGTCAMLTKYDTKMLYQSHLYKLRVLKPETIDPYLLLAVLNSPIIKRQIRAKQFTQDIIDTLGRRLAELVLPIPKDTAVRQRIIDETKYIVETRAELRRKAHDISLMVMGDRKQAEEQEALAEIL